MNKRKIGAVSGQWSRIPVILFVVAIALVIALLPAGPDSSPLICSMLHHSGVACSRSNDSAGAMIISTQAAVEQTQTSIAQTVSGPLAPATIPAIPLIAPSPTGGWNIKFDVKSDISWQEVASLPGGMITIEVLDGAWTSTKGTAPYSYGDGNGYICGKPGYTGSCVQPMPEKPTDALIGRIGEQIFYVGHGVTVDMPQGGSLSLRMNDGEFDLYDNDGSLKVGIWLH